MAVGQFNLGKASLDIIVNMSSVEKQLASARRNIDAFGLSWTRAIRIGAGIAGISSGIIGVRRAIEGTVGASLSFESSFAGVRKTVDATQEEFSGLEKTFRDMARTLPTSVVEINGVAEAAGQLGIKAKDLAAFTKVMIDLGNSTNLSAQDAAVGLARFANIMGTATDNFDMLGSVLVDLGNKFPAFESDILEISVRLAAAGKQFGLTEGQVMALGTALISTGVKVEAGGSAISRVLIAIQQAAADGGDKLNTLARITGTTAEQFAQLVQNNPAEALLQFVDALAQAQQNGAQVYSVLEDLGFNTIRIRQAVLGLANANDLLSSAFEAAGIQTERQSALLIEANKRYDTNAAKLTVMKNRILDVGISIGDSLMPALLSAVGGFATFVEGMAELEHQTGLVSAALGTLVVLITARVVGAFGKMALAGIIGNFVQMGTVLDMQVVPSMYRYTAAGELIVVENEAMIASSFSLKAALGGLVGSFATVNGVIAVFTGVMIGLDQLSRKLTGENLFTVIKEGIFGIDKAARGAENALKDLDNRLAQTSGNQDDVNTTIQFFNEQMQLYTQYVDLAKTSIGELMTGTDEFKQSVSLAKEYVDDIGGGLVALAIKVAQLGGSYKEVLGILDQLPPKLREEAMANDDFRHAVIKANAELYHQLFDVREIISGTVDQFESDMARLNQAAEDAQQQQEDFAKAIADSISDTFSQILPDVQGSFDDWLDQLDQLLSAYENFSGNINAIYATLVAAHVDNVGAIIQVLEEQGPLFVAQFTKFFAEDPAAAIQRLSELAPLLMAEVTANANAELAASGGEVAASTNAGINIPFLTTLAQLIPAAGQVGARAGAAFAASLNEAIALAGGTLPPGAEQAAATGFSVDDIIANLLVPQAGKNNVDIHSNVKSGGGGGGGSKSKIEEAAIDAADRFMSSFAEEARSSQWTEEMGSAGEGLADAFVTAIEDGTEANVDRLAAATQKFIDAVEKEGGTVGDDLVQTIVSALESGDEDIINAAIVLMEKYGTVLQDKAKEEAKDLGDVFAKAFADELSDQRQEERIGSSGVKLINYLEDGFENEKPSAIESAARIGADLIYALEEKFDGANIDGFVGHFMDVLARVIDTKGGEALAELQKLLAQINAALQTGGTLGDIGVSGGGGPSTGIQISGAITGPGGRQVLVGIDPISGKKVIQQGDGTWKYGEWADDAVKSVGFNTPGNATSADLTFTHGQSYEDAAAAHTVPSDLTSEQKANILAGTGMTPAEWFGSGYTISDLHDMGIEGFKAGISMIPRDMFAFLHRGERVLTAEENRRRMREGSDSPDVEVKIIGKDLSALIEKIETTKKRRFI